jgi:predicted DNA-binding transcriptional regulator AlpA
MTAIDNNIKQWLLPKLKRRNLSVEEFSKRCGLSRATLYSYMTDRYRPQEDTMGVICKTLSNISYWEDGVELIEKATIAEGLAQYIERRNGRKPIGRLKHECE